MNDKKYFKFPVIYVVLLAVFLSVIIFTLFLVRFQTAGVVVGIVLVLVMLTVFLPLLSWPIIKDEGLEVRWILPRLKREFLYNDLKRVVFKRSGRYYYMTIVGLDGKRQCWVSMECMPVGKLQEFIDDLRAHGVDVENRLNYTDVI